MECKMYYLFVFLAAAVGLASCQSISCYDCDPQNFAADCGNPVGNQVRSSPCSVDADVANGTSICVSAFLNVTGGATNTSGIYRGCRTLSPAVRDFCDWFREERQGFNATVLSCVACNSTRCNINRFRDDGTSSAPNAFVSSVFVLVFNTLLVTLLNRNE